MRPLCMLWRRRISTWVARQPIEPDLALRRHLNDCRGCAEYAEELLLLSRELQEAIQVPAPSDAFAFPEMMPIAPRSIARAPRPLGAPWLALAAGCLALVAWLVARPNAPNPPSVTVQRPAGINAEISPSPMRAGRPHTVIAQGGPSRDRQSVRKAAGTGTRTAVKQVQAPRVPPSDIKRNQPARPRRLMPPVSRQLAQSDSASHPQQTAYAWAAVAWQYEQSGGYLDASAAYRRAAQAAPSSALLMEAGRTAELGGSVSQALANYIRALEMETQSENHQKEERNG